MTAKVVLASRNRGKLGELREILRGQVAGLDVDTEVVDSASLGVADVLEDGVSFAENSLKKARYTAEATGLIAVADDSGLTVDILGGCPGIFSARWSGEHGNDTANLNLLLAQLADIGDTHRGAAFQCAASLVTPSGESFVEYGKLPGRILREPCGQDGFGYDPIMAPTELSGEYAGKSCAEIPSEIKNSISHRARALTALIPHLATVLAEIE